MWGLYNKQREDQYNWPKQREDCKNVARQREVQKIERWLPWNWRKLDTCMRQNVYAAGRLMHQYVNNEIYKYVSF